MTHKSKLLLFIIGSITLLGVILLMWANNTGKITIFGDENSFCSDSDRVVWPSGFVDDKIYDIKGTTNDSLSDKSTDMCKNKSTLIEHFCSNNQVNEEEIDCPNGCMDGICITNPDQAITKKGTKVFAGIYPASYSPEPAINSIRKQILYKYIFGDNSLGIKPFGSIINGIQSTVDLGMDKDVVNYYHNKGYMSMGLARYTPIENGQKKEDYSALKDRAIQLAQNGIDMITLDETREQFKKYYQPGETPKCEPIVDLQDRGISIFTGKEFNEIKDAVKKINPDVQIGMIEDIYCYNQYYQDSEKPDPDFIGAKFSWLPTSNQSWIDEFNQIAKSTFPQAKRHLWLYGFNSIVNPDITIPYLGKFDTMVLFDVDRILYKYTDPPKEQWDNPPLSFRLEDIKNELTKQYSAIGQINKCSDGTEYNKCSENDIPKYCDNGKLINKCSECGCSDGLSCQSDETCTQACSDNTANNSCSIDKPSFCQNGNLINNCAKCGCADGYFCKDDGTCEKEVQKCSDGTNNEACNVDNLPKYCENGKLTNNCSKCGCPAGQTCKSDGSCEIVCQDNTPNNSCSLNKPAYCQNGNLTDECSKCGCEKGYKCDKSGTCKSTWYSWWYSLWNSWRKRFNSWF